MTDASPARSAYSTTRRTIRRVRRVLLAAAFLGGLYLVWRIDVLRIPSAGCSPVLRYPAGAMLLLDHSPPQLFVDDVVLFAGVAEGELYLARIDRLEQAEGPLWVVADDPACAGIDSTTLGWIARDDVRARVLFALPW